MTRKKNRDKTSGSRTFNRIDFQISQGILFSVELYDSCDYLIALDYYDDLAVIENPDDCSIISYYQVKTTEDKLTIASILNKEWLADLYGHLFEDDDFDSIGELGLITNCRIRKKDIDENESRYINDFPGKTEFDSLGDKTADLIRQDIAKTLHLEPSEVDFSKLSIIRSTLEVHSHDEHARIRFTDFVGERLGNVGVQVIRAAYESLRNKFTACQRVELPDCSELEAVKSKKCISRNTLNETLKTISEIDFPSIDSLLLLVPDEDKLSFSIAYATAISDNLQAARNVTTVQSRIKEFIEESQLDEPYMTWQNACLIRDKYYEAHSSEFDLPASVNDYYVLVVAFVVLHHI